MTWKTLYTDPNKCEVKAIRKQLAEGPYTLIDQHDEDLCWREFFLRPLEWHKEFKLEFGKATYAINTHTGAPIKVGYWYDTSD